MFVRTTASECMAELRRLHAMRGGSMLAVTITAPRSTPDVERRVLVVNVAASLAERGDDLLGAFEGGDSRTKLHAHLSVLTAHTLESTRQLLDDAGALLSAGCVKPADLGWVGYWCAELRPHNIHDRLLRSAAVALDDGCLVRPRPLVAVAKPPRVQRQADRVTHCQHCQAELVDPHRRADALYCSDKHRQAAYRHRAAGVPPAGYARSDTNRNATEVRS